jgi:hypothetical protein
MSEDYSCNPMINLKFKTIILKHTTALKKAAILNIESIFFLPYLFKTAAKAF